MSCQKRGLPTGGELITEVDQIQDDKDEEDEGDKDIKEVHLHDSGGGVIRNMDRRKRGRRKRSCEGEAERVRKWKLNAEIWSRRMNEKTQVQAIKTRSREKRINKVKVTHSDEYYGNRMTTSEEWPAKTKRGTLRIYGQNINGISKYTEYDEWEIMLDTMYNQQIDIACLSEINLDMNKTTVKYKLQEKAKQMDRGSQIVTATSKTTVTETEVKRGGLLSFVRGNWSGRILDKGAEKLGRWTYVTMSGNKGKKVTIINTYRVCDQRNHGDGNCTIYMQQEKDLMDDGRSVTEPREALLRDLAAKVNQLTEKKHSVMVLGDMNDDADKSKRLQEFLEDTSMYDAIKKKFPGSGPTTYDRGSKCIDMIAVTNDIDPKWIIKCGYLPFYEGIFSDHRGMYVDLDIKAMFTQVNPDTNRDALKRFNTSQVKRCEKYVMRLEKYMVEASMLTKIDTLEQDMMKYIEKNTGSIDDMIERCKKLFEKMTQIMKASEKRVGRKHYPHGRPSSNQLREAASTLINCRKELRRERRQRWSNLEKLNYLEEQVRVARMKFLKDQKEAPKLRELDLVRLAEKRACQWNLKASQAIVVIRNSEEARKSHKKQKAFLKPVNGGGIKKILVPTPNSDIGIGRIKESHITDASIQCEVDDPKEIFNVLLRQNFRQLRKSENSVFTQGEIAYQMENDTYTNIIESILNGKRDKVPQDAHNEIYGTTLQNFIQNMQYATNKDGKKVKELQWLFGIEEYKAVFKNTKENIACGPSGLHMSHWKAAQESEKIMRAHSFFIWAAFKFGFAYSRWEQSWHCMLQKKAHPFAQKLRIIQLFEGDFNAGLKYLLGKQLSWHMHDQGIIDEEVFGSRKGRTGAEALITLQLLADHVRTWKINLALLFNDADGCFDRIPATLAELALLRVGCPRSITRAHTKIQQSMKHFVKTATGVSIGWIQYGKENKKKVRNGTILLLMGLIGGIGQGGGASPLIWMSVLLIMMGAYKQTQLGARVIDCVTKSIILMWIISYVDDNSIVRTFDHTATIQSMLEEMTASLTEWRKLLQITGGDLSIEKCKIILLKWKQTGIRGNYTYDLHHDEEETIKLQSKKEGHISTECVERIDPNQAERVLGIRLPLTGDMNIECGFRKKQLLEFSKRLYKSSLTTYEAHSAYLSRYIPIAKYPFPVTTFNNAQLETMQRGSIHRILPKLGVNRNMPRAVIYGPRLLGGRQLINLKVEQPISNLKTTIAHLRREDRVSKLLHATLNDLQIEVGVGKEIFQLDPKDFPYVTKNTRWLYTWKMGQTVKAKIKVWNQWIPTTSYLHDKNIMETALKDPYYHGKNRYRLVSVNRCRLYQECFFISDLMVNMNGQINRGYVDGTKKHKHGKVTIPFIRKPSQVEWTEWKEFIFRNFLAQGYNIQPVPTFTSAGYVPSHSIDTDEVTSLLASIHSSLSLQDMIQQVPEIWKSIMGTTSIPLDDGKELYETLLKGKVIGVSDGSLQPKVDDIAKGGHAYAIHTWNHDDNGMYGSAGTPSSTNMSSLTTELYGLIAATVLVHMIAIKYTIVRAQGLDVVIYADNKQAIFMGNEMTTPLNLSNTEDHEYDLGGLLFCLKKKCPINITYLWVPGHQDENEQGAKIQGPHPRPVQLNIKMDGLAKIACVLHSSTRIYRPVYSTTKMGLYTQHNVYIGDLREYIQYVTTAPPLIDYLKIKHGWTSAQFEQIHWNNLDLTLKSYRPFYRTKMAQLMHDWQHIGHRKELMKEDHAMCPAQCGERETHLHYMFCNDNEMSVNRDKHKRLLRKQLEAVNTYPGIIVCLMNIISKGMDDDSWWSDMDVTMGIDKKLYKVICIQKDLGIHSISKGYWYKGWNDVQNMWEQQCSISHQKYHWGKETLTAIHSYVYSCWKERNDIIHGKSEKSKQHLKKADIKKRINHLYNLGRANLNEREKNYFKLPVEQRVKRGIEANMLWIVMVDSFFKAKGAARQESMDTWLNTPEKSWRDRLKDNEVRNTAAASISGGEEVSWS